MHGGPEMPLGNVERRGPTSQLDAEEVVLFKARTKHGSGVKERYELAHCTDLRLDASTRARRSPDYLKASSMRILQWSAPKEENVANDSGSTSRGRSESAAKEKMESNAGKEAEAIGAGVMAEDFIAQINVGDSLLYARHRCRPRPPSPTSSGNETHPVPSRPIERKGRICRTSFTAKPTCHDIVSGVTGMKRISRASSDNSGDGGQSQSVAANPIPSGPSQGGLSTTSTASGSSQASQQQQLLPSTRRLEWMAAGVPECRVITGFESGVCAVTDPASEDKDMSQSYHNDGGSICNSAVTAIRVVPRTQHLVFVAAFASAELLTFDTTLPAPYVPPTSSTASQASTSSTTERAYTHTPPPPAVRRLPSFHSSAAAAAATSQSQNTSSGYQPPAPPQAASISPKNDTNESSNSGRGNIYSKGYSNSSLSNGGTSSCKWGMDVQFCPKGVNPVSRWQMKSGIDLSIRVSEMKFSPEGQRAGGRRLLACACKDGGLRVIDYDSQKLLVGFLPWFGGLLCLDWSQDGRYIATGGEDDSVCLWSIERKEIVMRCEGHSSWVCSVAFDAYNMWSPSTSVNGNHYRFISVGEDAKLCIWEYDEASEALHHSKKTRTNSDVPSSQHPPKEKSKSTNDANGMNGQNGFQQSSRANDHRIVSSYPQTASPHSRNQKSNEPYQWGVFKPPLKRTSAPRGTPLCCKQLARLPFKQVAVIRSGIITLCEEGLVKVWCRAIVPQAIPKSLPPLLLTSASTNMDEEEGGIAVESVEYEWGNSGDAQAAAAGIALIRQATDGSAQGVLITPLAGQRAVMGAAGGSSVVMSSKKKKKTLFSRRGFFASDGKSSQNAQPAAVPGHLHGPSSFISAMPLAASIGLVPAVGVKDVTSCDSPTPPPPP